jgi:uncharacterized protein YjaG (DUF416 family)
VAEEGECAAGAPEGFRMLDWLRLEFGFHVSRNRCMVRRMKAMFRHFCKLNPFNLRRLLMTMADNIVTLLTNQQTIISNQAAILTAIGNIPGGNNQQVTDALAKIETQVTDIDTQINVTQAPTPAPAAPAAS